MCGVALPWSRAAAQSSAASFATDDGVLAGRLVAADGRPAVHARVRIVAKAAAGSTLDEKVFESPSDARGRFIFLRLPSGSYQLFVQVGGESEQLAGPVAVVEGEEPRFVTLRLSTQGRASLNSSTLDDVLALQPIEEWSEQVDLETGQLPAAASSPGDRADTPAEDEDHLGSAGTPADMADGEAGAQRAATIAGSHERRTTLDGLLAEQGFRPGVRGGAQGGPVSGALFARAAVRNLRVGPRSYSALQGGTGFALQSRTGAKGLHGGGSVTVRLSAFDAANPYALVTHYRDGAISGGVVKPNETDVQAAAHVGFAPLGKHAGAWNERVLAFVSLDGRVRNAPVESSPAVANFYALTPTQRALLGTRGVTAAQTNAALNYLDGLSGEIARSDTRLLSFARLDVRAGSRDAVAVTFAGNHFRSPAGAEFDQLADAVVARGRGSVGDSAIDVEAVAGHWAHRFQPKLENAVGAQWVHDLEAERPRAPLSQEPAISPGGEAPQVEIAPEGFTYGTAANLDRSAYPDERRIEASDTLRWAMGRHVLSLGGSWSRVDDRVNSLRNANGTFLYDSDLTGGRAGGLVDWITDATFSATAYPNGGCPSITAAVHDFCFRTYTQSFGVSQQQFATHEFAGFAEDSFFAGTDLRVTMGVRYEYTLLPLPQVPNAGLDAGLRALALPSPLAGVTSAFPEDRNNVAPRVGLVWAPHGGRWATVHAGYGWFFGRVPGTTIRTALADNGLATGIAQVRITPATETLCPQVSNQGFGYPCAFIGTPPSAVAQTGTVMLFSSSFRLPAVQRASLAVERGLGKRFAIELGYQGAWATQLPTSVDVNIAPATSVIHLALQGGGSVPELASGRNFTVPLYTARRLASIGPVTAITSQANATYHAGSLAARMGAWHGMEARGSVTFSRAIDDNPESGTSPRVNGNFDTFAIGYDKGLSNLQVPLRFAGSVVARTALHSGPRPLREALGGWRVAASGSAVSGAPYGYQIFGGTRLPGGHTSINGSGGASFLPAVGRNTLRLPARGNVDLRVERGGSLHGVRLNGFAEAFNLLNERNLSRVETRAFLPGAAVNGVTPLVFQDTAAVVSEGVSTPAFGTPTSSTSGVSRERLVALGFRVEF